MYFVLYLNSELVFPSTKEPNIYEDQKNTAMLKWPPCTRNTRPFWSKSLLSIWSSLGYRSQLFIPFVAEKYAYDSPRLRGDTHCTAEFKRWTEGGLFGAGSSL